LQSFQGALNPRPAGWLNLSGASKTYAYLPGLHQNRYQAGPLSEPQHLFHGLRIFYHVPIKDLQALFSFGLPGLNRERSGVFAENGDLLGHGPPP